MSARPITPIPNRMLTGSEDFDGLTQVQESLPATWYVDSHWYQRELEKIFCRNWLYLCHASTVSAPRSFRRFTIGDQGIFLVRDDDGELRGFYNTCRHRGSVLCVEPQGTFSNRLVLCPYHQWAYSLDGRLVKTSSHAEAMDFDKADYALLPVMVREWRGGVFASLSDTPPDMSEGFGRGSDRTENWPMEELVVGHTWNRVLQCNWKVFWENFNECLHCPNIHPELCDLVPIFGRRISYFRDHAYWQEFEDRTDPRYVGGLRPGARTWSKSGNPSPGRFNGLSEEEIQRGQSYFVSLPSVFVAAHADYVRTVRILPLGPEKTEISVEWLFLPEALEQDNFDMADITDFAKMVMEQDAEVSEINQQGLHSRPFEQGVLMPEEHHVKAFQDWVREQMKE